MAVLSSGLMGTVSGTPWQMWWARKLHHPLMKSLNYRPAFAGAVEAAARPAARSCPHHGVPRSFGRIRRRPVHQSLRYSCSAGRHVLFAILMMVDFEAARTGLVGLPKEELPNVREILKQGWHLLFPLVLVLILLVKGYTPHFTAFWCIVATFFVTLVRKETRMTPQKIFKALASGATGAVINATSCAIAGIIIGVVSLTGLGVKFTSMVYSFAGGRLPVALFLTMIASWSGMGVPRPRPT